MSIIKYRAFLAVVDTGSLTKAAKALNYTQPGISHMIASLEEETGFPLLVRNRDFAVPTENAKSLIYHYRQIINSENRIHEIIDDINGIRSGSIQIGAFNSALTNWIPDILSRYLSRYPNVRIQVSEYDCLGIAKSLSEGLVDLAFTSDYVASAQNFDFIPLHADPILVVMPKGHPLAVHQKIPVAAMNGQDYLMPFAGSDDLVNFVMQKEPFEPNVRHRVSSDNALPGMVGHGFGIALMSKLLLRDIPDSIETRPLEGDYARTLGIAVKSLKDTTPAINALISVSKEWFAEKP